MPNTGNTQQIINYGATANDGTGDPLRTAFIKTDENFDNVWLAGPVGSNITISNNTIQTNNTNGNIILKPNGTGIIQANASIIPNSTGTRDLGSSALSWRRAYINDLFPQTLTVSGDATIGGNLTIQGDTIQIGNITTDTLTIQLANTAANKTAANGAGITVGANDAIATFLFNSTSNTWVTNIGANIGGNVTASYFIGNGSLLTGITQTGNYVFANNQMSISNEPMEIVALGAGADVDIEAADAVFIEALAGEVDIRSADETFITTNAGGNIWTFGINGTLTAPGTISTSGNISGAYILGNGSQLTGLPASYGNSNVAAYLEFFTGNISAGNLYVANNATVVSDLYVKTGTFYGDAQGHDSIYAGVPLFTNLGTGVIAQFSGNTDTYTQFNFQNGNAGPLASGDYVITADNGNDTTHFLNIGLTGSGWNGTQPNSLGADLGPNDGYFYVQDGNLAIGVKDGGTAYVWKYANTGNLTLPNNGSIIVDSGDGVIGPVSDDMVISWDNEEIRLVSVQGSIEMQADNAFRVQTNYDGGTDTYLSRWEFSQDEIVNITGPSAIVTEAGNLTLSGGRNSLASGNVNVVAVDNGVLVSTWTFDNNGNLTAPGNITTTGNVSGDVGLFNDVNLNNAGTNRMLYVDGDRNIYDTDFSYYSGNSSMSGSGNITAGYFIGDGSLLTGLPASYGNANVADFLANGFGSNTISTTGNITGNTGGFAIGYRDIPQVTFSANATAALADAGKHYYSTTAGNLQLTLPDNVSVDLPTGATLTIVVNAAGNVLVGQGTGVTLYQAGSATTGNRVVGAYGLATVMKVAANTWVISGTGVY